MAALPRPAALATLLVAAAASSAEPVISWDADLAFEWDRASYERTLVEIVRSAFRDAAAELGLPAKPPAVHVLTPARYAGRFGADAAARDGAHYEAGAIWVNGGRRLDDAFAGLVAHEMTHAVVDSHGTALRLPTWLNEGLAERLSWKRRGLVDLAGNQVWELKGALGEGRLLPLPTRGPLTGLGYLESYAAVLFLERRIGRDRLLAIVRRTLGGEPFERALDAETRWTPDQLDREFRSWVEHL